MQKGFDVVNIHGTASAVIAVPVIGENGNWFIGNVDTGVSAQGPKGDVGEPGPKRDMGPAGSQGVQGPIGAQGPNGDKGDTGAAGLFSAMDLIFSGTAGTKGSVYNLTKPITDYKELRVEIEGFNVENQGWMYGYGIIVHPGVSDVPAQYGCYQYGYTLSLGSNLMFCAYFHFPTADTMKIDAVGELDIITNQRVTKIYGIK